MRGGMAADRKARRMAGTSLGGEAGTDQQTAADDGVDEHEHQLALQIRSDQERRQEDETQQRAVGPAVAAVLEQADVLVVIGLEDRAHRGFQTFLCRLRPNRPSGLTISTTSSRM